MSTVRTVKLLAALGMAALIVLSLLGCVLACAWDADTYAQKSRDALAGMSEDEITAYLGMDADTQRACAQRIRDYFAGRVDDMDFILPDGTHAFNEKELSHMQDVRGLVRLGASVELILAIITLAIALGWRRAGKRLAPGDAAAATLAGLKSGAGLFVLLAVAVLLAALANFRAVFELFHRLAFANENWLLDPRTDRLIRMMPQNLFETLCIQIALGALILPLLAAGAAWAHQIALKRKREMR